MANTTTLNSELFVNFLQDAQFAAYENSVARQLVTAFDQPFGSGKTIQVPIWDAVTAEILGETTDATPADTDTNSITVTLTEHVSAHKITDMLANSTIGTLEALAMNSGRAIAESMDKQVFALFTNFDEGGPGAGGTLTVEHILKAAAKLRARKLTGPFYCVLNPAQAFVLKKELSNAGAATIPSLSNLGNSVLSAGLIGQVAGVYVFENALVGIDANVDAVGSVFSSTALVQSMRGGVTMESGRDVLGRATLLTVKAEAGAAVARQQYGIKLTSDATL